MNGFDIFLMDYTFALRILIFLRHTKAYEAFTETEQKIINRNIIDDKLISNIKNYLRGDMFQNDGDDQMIHLFWKNHVDYYDLVEILYNVSQAVEKIKKHINSIEEVIANHIQIIKNLDMTSDKIDPVMAGIYRPATFAYFPCRRSEIMKINNLTGQKTADFYYPCPYANCMDSIKKNFQHLVARTHYLGSIDLYKTSFGDAKNPKITDSNSFNLFIDHIVKCAKQAGNNNTIANPAVIKQLIEGQDIIFFCENVLNALCISVHNDDLIALSRYRNYYLWIQGLHHNEQNQVFNFFFSAYDPFQNFFIKTFAVSQHSIRGGDNGIRANSLGSSSAHAIYFVVFLIVILFVFYLIWQKNNSYAVQQTCRGRIINTQVMIQPYQP